VNDQYGHEVGDFVLKSVAQQLSSTVRESDFVARYGGEEFVVLLPATSLEGAVALAENLRQAVENAPILDHHPISISIGVSVVQAGDSDAQDAMRRADKYLYQAKAQGRNRVIGA
jgi:diguanylate cyclase